MAARQAPNTLGAAVIAVAWVFGALAIIVVASRFYVRMRIVRRLFTDDYIIVITFVSEAKRKWLLFHGSTRLIHIHPMNQVFAIINSVLVTVSVSWGLGHHIDILSPYPEQIHNTVKWMFLSEIFAIMSPGFGRISFAFLLLGLLPPSRPRAVRPKLLWSLIAIQFVVDMAAVIISMVQCRPIAGFWDRNIEAGCWDPRVQQYAGFVQGCKLGAGRLFKSS